MRLCSFDGSLLGSPGMTSCGRLFQSTVAVCVDFDSRFALEVSHNEAAIAILRCLLGMLNMCYNETVA